MKYIISAHGTKGDILPFFRVAFELQERGNSVMFLANSYFEEIIVGAGFEFISTGSECDFLSFHSDSRLWDPAKDALDFGFDRIIKSTIERSFIETVHQYDNSKDICVVGVEPNFNGAFWAADLLGVKAVAAYLWPSCIDSMLAPPAPLKWFIPGWFSPVMRDAFITSMRIRREKRIDKKKYFADMNLLRSKLGLKRADGVSNAHAFAFSGLRIGLFPPWFGTPAPDWPANFNLTGFPELPHHPSVADDILAKFVERHGPPVLFTSGTGVFDTEEIFKEGYKACCMLGKPALFIGGSLPKFHRSTNAPYLHLDYVDFSFAFPKCSAIVHHGGVGTLAQALRAQVPQLIRPLSFDQPDNADRVKLLGIGSYILPKKFTARRVAKELANLIDNPDFEASISFYANLMKRQNVTKEICNLIETYVAQPDLDFGLPIQRIVKNRSAELRSVDIDGLITPRATAKDANGDHEALFALLSYADADVQLLDLHTRSPHTLTLGCVVEICRDYGVPVRALRVRAEAMTEVNTPCLIQWQQTRFVLFLGFKGDEAKIFDPVLKQQSYTLHEFSWNFSGYVVEIVKRNLLGKSDDYEKITDVSC